MRGKSNITRGITSLPLIFWHIRTCRKSYQHNERRSWMRLARLQLKAQRPDLTEQERHEIMVVWSQPDCIMYHSPALNKVTKNNAAQLDGARSVRPLYRAAFNIHGKRIKKTRKVRVSSGSYAPIVVPVRTLRVQRVVVPPRPVPPPLLLGALLGRALALH